MSSTKSTDFSKSFRDTLKRLNMIDNIDDNINNDIDDNIDNIITTNNNSMLRYAQSSNATYTPSTSNSMTSGHIGYENVEDDDDDDVEDDDDDNYGTRNNPIQPPVNINIPTQRPQQPRQSNNRGRQGEFDEDEIRRAIEASIQDYDQVMTNNSKLAKEQAKLMFEASKNGLVHEIPEELYYNEHLIEEIFRTLEKMQETEAQATIITEQNDEFENAIIADVIARSIISTREAPPVEAQPVEVPPVEVPPVEIPIIREEAKRVLSRAELAAKRLAALSNTQ